MKTKLIILFIAVLSVSSISCMKNRDNIYTGADVIEFVPITASVKKGTAVTPGSTKATVQLVGKQKTVDTEVNYTLTGTAVIGTDYTVAGTTSGKVLIPANTSAADIVITVVPAGIPTGTKTVILTLTGAGNGVGLSANYTVYTLTITQ